VSILRRATLLVVLVAAVGAGDGVAKFTPPALKGKPQFVVSGHGWGHGVGMSQWGAYGYAKKGFTYDRILAHYYPGTQLGTTTVKSIRVLLANSASLTVSSTAAWRLKDGDAATTKLAAGSITLNPQLTLKLPGESQAQAFTGPLTFSAASASAPLVFKKSYRGTFTVTSDGKKLTLVNTVPLDQYLYGVVPSEMPKTWSAEALKTQAVAARSYALAVRKTGGAFDVYPDTRSQVYGGVSAEAPTTTAAVDGTTGEVLSYVGRVATTYFHSTSGGRTAAIADVWKSAAVPYLVSVSDPYDTASPYHSWGPLEFSDTKLGKALKAKGRLLDVETTPSPSQRVTSVTVVGEKGESVVSGADVQEALGLRSTWFSVGVLSLDPLPAAPLAYGTPFSLTGIGRALPDLRLEQREPGTTEWVMNRGIAPAPDGSYTVATKAAVPAEFRVVSGTVATPTAVLAVTPRVSLRETADLLSLKGAVTPKLPGAAVRVQQLKGKRWTTVAKTTVDRAGRFRVTPATLVGTYRATVLAGHGWAAGRSAPVLAQ